MNGDTYERPARARWTKGQTLEERFWERVDKQEGEDACWLWTAALRENGYGMMMWEGHCRSTHKIAYELENGPVESGVLLRHNCADRYPAGDHTYRRCCRPKHMIEGTHKQNSEDMVAAGRQARGDTHGARTRPLSRPRGELHGMAWFTAAQVDDLQRRYPKGTRVPYTALAEEYGCHRQTIHNVLHGRFWKEHKNPRPLNGERHQKGEAHGQAKLTIPLVEAARIRHLAGEPINKLATEYGVGRSVMRDAIEGITWAHVPGAVAREDRPQTQFRQGAAQPHAKLTDELVREGRRLYAGGMKVRAIARHLDRPYSLVYDAVTGKTWRHVTA